MSGAIKTGGPAFPHDMDAVFNERAGMSLRDHFASKAMEARLNAAWVEPSSSSKAYQTWIGELPPDRESALFHDWIAECAYQQADAMLKAREGGAP